MSGRGITLGPGYRVYFDQDGGKLVILLCGGTKNDSLRTSSKPRHLGTTIKTENRKETDMPLTKDFKDTIKARAERDPEFRVGLFREAI